MKTHIRQFGGVLNAELSGLLSVNQVAVLPSWHISKFTNQEASTELMSVVLQESHVTGMTELVTGNVTKLSFCLAFPPRVWAT